MAMKQDIILPMAVTLALALGALAAAAGGTDAGQRRSRFALGVEIPCISDFECHDPGNPTCCGDGGCVDTSTSTTNCGKCGKKCRFTQSCCSGKCVDTSFDKKNCGFCSNKCKHSCLYGLCDYV